MWEEDLTGENPCNQVGTKNLIHVQGSGLKWDSNQGPQRWKALGKETIEPIWSKQISSPFPFLLIPDTNATRFSNPCCWTRSLYVSQLEANPQKRNRVQYFKIEFYRKAKTWLQSFSQNTNNRVVDAWFYPYTDVWIALCTQYFPKSCEKKATCILLRWDSNPGPLPF